MGEIKGPEKDRVEDLEALLAARDVTAASVLLDKLYDDWEGLPDQAQARINALEGLYLTLVASEFELALPEISSSGSSPNPPSDGAA